MATRRYTKRRKKGGKWCSPSFRLAVYLRDGFTCQYCGVDMTTHSRREVTLDHLVCHRDGGTDDEANLVSACKSCNSAKGCQRWTRFAKSESVRRRIRNAVRRKLNLGLASSLIKGTAGRGSN